MRATHIINPLFIPIIAVMAAGCFGGDKGGERVVCPMQVEVTGTAEPERHTP